MVFKYAVNIVEVKMYKTEDGNKSTAWYTWIRGLAFFSEAEPSSIKYDFIGS